MNSTAYIISPDLVLDGIKHGFFTREGGVSTGVYDSLNCGLGSNDDRNNVVENRRRAAEALEMEDDAIITVHQVHSPEVVTVTGPFSGPTPEADGIVTRTKGLVLGALTADCAPILFAAPSAGVIGACHAGWRGALAGISDNTIMAMERLGAVRPDIRAVVGPCISRESYEIGPDFAAAFMDEDPANGRFFRASRKRGHAFFDLPGYLVARLTASGIECASATGQCTYLEEDRFFSYRRTTHKGESDYGRQISTICMPRDEVLL